MHLENHEIAVCMRGNLGRNFELEPGYQTLVAKILHLSDQDITLDGMLSNTRILKYDFDAERIRILCDGTIINERVDTSGNQHVIVTRYPSGKISFSYRTTLKNSDGDYVFSSERVLGKSWTALDLNGFLSTQSDYYGSN